MSVPSPSPVPVSYASRGLVQPLRPAPGPETVHIPFILFCFLIPLAANVLELLHRWCSHLLFDPFPSVWHALLALGVAPIILIVYLRTRQRSDRPRPLLRLFAGIALGASIYFSVMFLPLLPVGIIGILAAGLGFLVLSPFFALVGSAICLYRVVDRTNPTGMNSRLFRVPFGTIGLLLSLTVLMGGEARKIWTNHQAATATRSVSAEDRADALRSLRNWGDTSHLLDTAVGRRSETFASGGGWQFLTRDKSLTAADIAGVYYRVTGKLPDAEPADALPGNWRGASARPVSRDWSSWVEDNLRGGDVVGAPIEGLSLVDSSFTGTVHADALTAYVEWILEFDNQTVDQQEARCRIALPDGGVVSRVTLWINGKECEAAYGSTVKVREAYQSVAVVQRRDPVLVTASGPGAVMLQCFPVPSLGRMQTKIGVTIPLRLSTEANARFSLPYIIERNFSAGDGKAGGLHRLALDAGLPLNPSNPAQLSTADRLVVTATPQESRHNLTGRLSEVTLSGRGLAITADRRPERQVAWGVDPFDADGHVVVQTLSQSSIPSRSRFHLVVDGSSAMKLGWTPLCDAIESLPIHLNLRCDIAGDQVRTLSDATPAQVAAFLRSYEPVGGQDAVKALEASLGTGKDDDLVLWVRGPQPLLLADLNGVRNRLQALPSLVLKEVVAVPSVNRVAEKLAEDGRLSTAVWDSTLAETLNTVIGHDVLGHTRWHPVRTRQSQPPEGDNVVKSNIDLARLWGDEEVRRKLSLGESHKATAAVIGSRYRLVTAVSGAVVLENQEQYDDHGLTPVSVVPLPPAAWAILVMLPLVILAKRRLTRRAA